MSFAEQKNKGMSLIAVFVVALVLSTVGAISCSHAKKTSPDAPKEHRTKTGKTIVLSETHPVPMH